MTWKDAIEMISALKEERDELLAVLKKIAQVSRPLEHPRVTALTIIKKIEGKETT